MDWFSYSEENIGDSGLLDEWGAVSPELADQTGLQSISGGSYGETAFEGDQYSAEQSFTDMTAPALQAGGDLLSSAGGWLEQGANTVFGWFKDIFTDPDTTVTRRDAQGNLTTATKEGGINDLSKILIAGAIQSIGQGKVLKWQEERQDKREATQRRNQVEDRDEAFRRKKFGSTPQMGAQPGLVKGGMV